MKKIIAALAMAGAVVAVSAVPASAQESTETGQVAAAGAPFGAGPFRTMSDCRASEKQVKKQGHKIVTKCGKGRNGFFFTYR